MENGNEGGSRFCAECHCDRHGTFSEVQCQICCEQKLLCGECLDVSLHKCMGCEKIGCKKCVAPKDTRCWDCCEKQPDSRFMCDGCHAVEEEAWDSKIKVEGSAHGRFNCDFCFGKLCPRSQGCQQCVRECGSNPAVELAQIDVAVLCHEIDPGSLHNRHVCKFLEVFASKHGLADRPPDYSFIPAGSALLLFLDDNFRGKVAPAAPDNQDAILLSGILPKLHSPDLRACISDFVDKHRQPPASNSPDLRAFVTESVNKHQQPPAPKNKRKQAPKKKAQPWGC